ncbi:retrovirus-related pol polyprotein from transposon TNT 1-94 [Tanacetum coccineum]
MLCYLTGLEPYYITCIKDGPFQPKTAEGAKKLETQWSNDERKVFNQDQRLKSIIISCIQDDIMESTFAIRHLNKHGLTWFTALKVPHNLISKRYPESKKGLDTEHITAPISTAFFSNNIIQDFQKNYDDEVDERTSEEYLRDIDIEIHERGLLAGPICFIERRNIFSGSKANENTKSYKCGKTGHFAKDCFSKTSVPSY